MKYFCWTDNNAEPSPVEGASHSDAAMKFVTGTMRVMSGDTVDVEVKAPDEFGKTVKVHVIDVYCIVGESE